jgi:putative colanic acid biosynthesis UDP-glucose lipid carrier transferase
MLSAAAQLAAVTVVYWVWMACSPARSAYQSHTLEAYADYWLLLVIGLVAGVLSRRQDDGFGFQNFAQAHDQAVRLMVFGLLPWAAYLLAFRDLRVSRVFLFGMMPLLHATLVVTERYVPPWLARRFFQGQRVERTVLVGTPQAAEGIQGWLGRREEMGVRVLGLVSPPAPGNADGKYRILGGVQELPRVIELMKATQVVLLGTQANLPWTRFCLEACERRGVRLLILSDLEGRLGHQLRAYRDEGLHFYSLREEPLENPLSRMLKRGFDVAVALAVGLPAVAAAAAVVWVVQRWQSPGPLFYRQKRTGFHREPFEMLKFRTMHVANDDPARQATANDPRVFRAGRWLRRYSLDELPQFINVLRGEMSVVGPRPHLAEHDAVFARALENYHVRTAIKPGITGLAQVRGFRGEATSGEAIRKRVECDVHYLENWTLAMDVWIVTRTALQVFVPPKSAY